MRGSPFACGVYSLVREVLHNLALFDFRTLDTRETNAPVPRGRFVRWLSLEVLKMSQHRTHLRYVAILMNMQLKKRCRTRYTLCVMPSIYSYFRAVGLSQPFGAAGEVFHSRTHGIFSFGLRLHHDTLSPRGRAMNVPLSILPLWPRGGSHCVTRTA